MFTNTGATQALSEHLLSHVSTLDFELSLNIDVIPPVQEAEPARYLLDNFSQA